MTHNISAIGGVNPFEALTSCRHMLMSDTYLKNVYGLSYENVALRSGDYN